MIEIISGLWLCNQQDIKNPNFMKTIDIPINCNFQNNIELSFDLKIQQFKTNLTKIINYIYKNLLNLKNIVLYSSNELEDEMQQTEIILVAFLMKYCKINMNTAIHLIIQKTKKPLFKSNNYFYKEILQSK